MIQHREVAANETVTIWSTVSGGDAVALHYGNDCECEPLEWFEAGPQYFITRSRDGREEWVRAAEVHEIIVEIDNP